VPLFDDNSRQRIFEQILGTGITGIFALFGVFLWNSATQNTTRAELNRVNIEANREVFTQKLSAIALELQDLKDEFVYSEYSFSPPPDLQNGSSNDDSDELLPSLPVQRAAPNFTEQIQQALDKEIYRRGENRGLE